jgi:tetratricopeptide (TPR) repeat protein
VSRAAWSGIVATVALVAGLALAAVVATSCGNPDDATESSARVTALPGPDEALSEPLMLALAQARNYHHKADVLLREARVDEAAAALRQILSIPFPPGAPEAEDVLLDARARLAKLLTSGDQPEVADALAVVDQGIAAARRPSFFLANLYTARGEVLEVSAERLAERDPAAARAARVQAIEAFDRSIEINEALMRKLIREESP